MQEAHNKELPTGYPRPRSYQPMAFEEPVAKLEDEIFELRRRVEEGSRRSRGKLTRALLDWRRACRKQFSDPDTSMLLQIARHAARPHAVDYIRGLCEDFLELHGDRRGHDDGAVIAGVGLFRGRRVCVIGEEKGADTKDRMARNFGMPLPSGYRKAIRVAELASRYDLPVITLVDTPGAYPGVQAEETGQSEAIAACLRAFFKLRTPNVAVIIGEAGSGGALALAVANRVLMLQYAIYSVMSPEGCATLLWKSASESAKAAKAMKIDAQSLRGFGMIDDIIPEGLGGGHREPRKMVQRVGDYLEKELDAFQKPEIGYDYALERMRKFQELGPRAPGAF